MSHSLTESSTFDPAVTVPDDGDARNAASVQVPFQALANRAKYLYDNRLARDPVTGNVAVNTGSINNFGVSGLTQLANCQIAGTLQCSSGISLLFGTLTTGGAGSIGDCAVTGRLTMSGGGNIRWRQATTPNADTSYGVADTDAIIIPGSGMTASRNFKVLAAGAVTGSRMRVYNHDGARSHNIVNDGGTAIATVPAASAIAGNSYPGFVELEWMGDGVGSVRWIPCQRQP